MVRADRWLPAGCPALPSPPLPLPLQLTSSGSGGSGHWPDSPSAAAGSMSPSRSSWRGSAFLDASSAASSPKAGAATDGSAGGAGGFNPASELSPLAHPEAALQQALTALQQAAASQKKELDWQAQYEALRTARRLARHHPAVLAPPALHALVALAAPVIDALRSTMSRLAIAVFQVGRWLASQESHCLDCLAGCDLLSSGLGSGSPQQTTQPSNQTAITLLLCRCRCSCCLASVPACPAGANRGPGALHGC